MKKATPKDQQEGFAGRGGRGGGSQRGRGKLMNNIFCEDGHGLPLGIVGFKPRV